MLIFGEKLVRLAASESCCLKVAIEFTNPFFSQEKGAEAVRNLRCTSSLEDFGFVDIVIEAIVESEEVKRKLFAQLDNTLKASAILASNTSSISITRIASATRRPSQVSSH